MPTEIFIYDVIDSYWGVGAKNVLRALADASGPVTVRVNSPGGDAFEGVAIYNALRRYGAGITVEVDGIAASAASIIAMAGTEIRMAKGSMMMVHEAWGFTMGPAADHEATATMQRKLSNELGGIYAARTGQSEEKVLQLMADETWMGADEAKALGFCDAVIAGAAKPAPETPASARAMASFKKLPQALRRPTASSPLSAPQARGITGARAPIMTPLAQLTRRA
jgi:ATP-dependent Clp protease, protease subunit